MTSDQSVTSTSSRVRQFGLYRTIDARTEEFLRLSRKRQIRQGCACAAVSTAITVTIIVSILLVFEFNVVPHDPQKSMQNWGSLINNTAEENLYDKVNVNIDKITLKMLPIIIKALNKNKLIDKFLDDYTTPRTTYERRHTTEFTYKKNVFSGRNNWIRLPASRLLAIEYKTSPIVYFKTQKNDYFTKIRKIRDYQRIINYVDKMISDRVTYGSTQPMKRNDDYTADDAQTRETTPIPKDNFNRHAVVGHEFGTTTEKITSKSQKVNNCKCPKKIGAILNNLISNIKLLIPNYESTESTFLSDGIDNSPCNKEKIKQSSFNSSVSKLNVEVMEKRFNHTTESPQFIPDLKIDSPEQYEPPKLNELKRDQTLKTIVSLLQPNVLGQKLYSFKGHSKYVITTPPMYIERTETNEEKTTLPITGQGFARHDPFHLITTATEFGFQQKINFNKRIPPDTEYNSSTRVDDYLSTTSTADSFLNLDVHSLELVKRKLVSPCKKTKEMDFKKPSEKVENNDISKIQDIKQNNVTKDTAVDITKMLYPIATVHYLYHRHNTSQIKTTPKTTSTVKSTTTTTRRPFIFITSTTQTTSFATETTHTPAQENTTKSLKINDVTFFVKNKMPIKHQILDQKVKDETNFRSEEINLDDDFEKILIEENYQENDYKDRHVEETTGTANSNLGQAPEKKDNVKSKADSKDKDDFFFTSMALYNKPRSYLEIQRSNLKPDENDDLNLNNLFE